MCLLTTCTYQAGEGAHDRSVSEADRDGADAHELIWKKRDGTEVSGSRREVVCDAWNPAFEIRVDQKLRHR